MTNPNVGPGHNSISAQKLKSFIGRIERVEVDVANAQADRKEIYAEAKSAGFDAKIMRKVVRLRKLDPADRAEEDALVQTYMDAVGD